MKGLVIVISLAILLVGVALIGLGDTHISVADTSIPDNKITTSQTEARNSSAIAIIMIAWTTASDEGD